MENLVTFAPENQLTGIVLMDAMQNPTVDLEELLDQIEASSPTEPPCRYTDKEAVERVIEATADVDSGRDLLTLEEFEKRVASWQR